MHRRVRDHIESVLTGSELEASCRRHLDDCRECREEVEAMREQANLFRALGAPPEEEPRAGFYARVIERIEAQTPASIWSLFFDSAFARRVALASVTFTLLIGIYLVSSERRAEQTVVIGAPADWVFPGEVPSVRGSATALADGLPDRDAVLVNLVTYREQ
jgi:anti-sigma factor RsiW